MFRAASSILCVSGALGQMGLIEQRDAIAKTVGNNSFFIHYVIIRAKQHYFSNKII